MTATFDIGFAASDVLREHVGLTASAQARVATDGAEWIAGVANAYDSGWATCWPAGSAVFLERVEQHWRQTPFGPGRLLSAIEQAASQFRAEAGAFAPSDLDDDFQGRPAVTTTFVDSQGVVVWSGPSVAFHVRGDSISHTAPHTLAQEWRAAGREPPDHLPTVITRSISADNETTLQRDRFEFAPGDRFTIVCTRPAEITDLLEVVRDGEAVAQTLAERLIGEPPSFATVLVGHLPLERAEQ